MELIVKIGADQQGLRNSIEKMKSEFRNMNVSSPAGWAGGAVGGGFIGMNRSRAGGGMGGILGGAGGELGGAGAAFSRLMGVSLRGGIWVTALVGLKKLWEYASEKFSTAFWERVYGINPQLAAKFDASLKTLHQSMSNMFASRARLADVQDKRILDRASPEQLRARLTEENKKVKAAESDLEYAKKASKETVGLGGKPLTAYQQSKLTREQADAEDKLNRAKLKQIEIEDRYQKSLSEAVQEGVKRKAEKDKTDKEENDKWKKYGAAGKGDAFKPDALAAAGLFAGSSLLANPDLSINREQLDVLRRIETNTSKGMFT